MKKSRKIQTAIQIIGSVGEIVLFLAGFFLGSKAFITAAALIVTRMIIKVVMSELMYRRQQLIIDEGLERVRRS